MVCLQTSSLLFLLPNGTISIEGHERKATLSFSDIKLLSFYSSPASIEAGLEAGFTEEHIRRAEALGYLVELQADVPRGGIWEHYNLQRAAFLMYDTMLKSNNNGAFRPVMRSGMQFEEHFAELLKRRTERFFCDKPVAQETLDHLLNDLHKALESYPWLSARILVQAVEGFAPGVYEFNREKRTLLACQDSFKRKDLLECVHGQWWVNGGGFCCFFVVSLEKLALKDGNGVYPQSYFEMILLLGEAGQVLLNAATVRGLGSWMTPAVSESIASKILGLKEDEEALYFFKVGIPDRGAKDSGEKRSPLEH